MEPEAGIIKEKRNKLKKILLLGMKYETDRFYRILRYVKETV